MRLSFLAQLKVTLSVFISIYLSLVLGEFFKVDLPQIFEEQKTT